MTSNFAGNRTAELVRTYNYDPTVLYTRGDPVYQIPQKGTPSWMITSRPNVQGSQHIGWVFTAPSTSSQVLVIDPV